MSRYTERELSVAAEDIAWRIFAGKHRYSVADILDMAYDDSLANVREIGTLIDKVCSSHGDDRASAVYDLDAATRRMVDEFIAKNPEMVRDRADDLALEEQC